MSEETKEPISLSGPTSTVTTTTSGFVAASPTVTDNSALKEMQAKLEAYQKADEKRKQDELAAQGRFQEVIAEQQKKIEEMKAQQEQLRVQSEALSSTVKQRIESLPEEFKPLMSGITDPVAQLNQLSVIDGILKRTQSTGQVGFVNRSQAPVDFQAEHQNRMQRNRAAMLGRRN